MNPNMFQIFSGSQYNSPTLPWVTHIVHWCRVQNHNLPSSPHRNTRETSRLGELTQNIPFTGSLFTPSASLSLPPCNCSPSWAQAWENLHTPDRSTHIRWPNIAHNNVISLLPSPPPAPWLSPPRPHPSLPSSISALLFIPNSTPHPTPKEVSTGSNSEFVDIIWISKACQALKRLPAEETKPN